MYSGKFVSIVEDDDALREGLIGLVRSLGLAARGYASAEEYLAVQDGMCACLVADAELPAHNAAEMVSKLRKMGFDIPVIMIGEPARPAFGDDPDGEAVYLLGKPFDADALADCLRHVLGGDVPEAGTIPRPVPRAG